MTKDTQKQRYDAKKDKQRQQNVNDDAEFNGVKRVIEYMNAKKKDYKI